jgi:uncharacterized repeat protein (TIGR03803 family)
MSPTKLNGCRLLACGLALASIAPSHAQTFTETVLHHFADTPRGENPYAGVIRDSAGNLYGTTSFGGASNAGVVYKVNPAGTQTVLYSFTGGTDGKNPYAGVIADSSGNLYGTTALGGTVGSGTVYKVDTTGHETVLYSFTGEADGSGPYAGVIRDSAGNLYGTTQVCGSSNCGVVYKLNTSGQLTVLYSFTDGADGGYPQSGVIRDSAGNLYGTTEYGGAADAGVVYKLNTAGQETVLYSFTGGTDGGNPIAGVIHDSAGNLYGTTYAGGLLQGFGVVYELTSAGQEIVLYTFLSPSDGWNPRAGVVRDSAGNLYGTTLAGGAWGGGVVYKLTGGQETVLYSFTGGAVGSYPQSGVILDSAGNLYGTASGGAAFAGVVYKLDTAGQETVLYSFPGATGGTGPDALERDSAGDFYGTTFNGGPVGRGVLYKLDAAGQETVLHNFTGGADGGYPQSGVIRDSAGNLYGTAVSGGTVGFGVVYKLSPTGQQTVLHNFSAGADGAYPYSGVVRDAAGNLYGDTSAGGPENGGVVYRLDTAGNETILYSFTGGADGGQPNPGLIQDSAGNLYGTTYRGGTSNAGVVFKVNPSGKETVLHTFTGGADGGQPESGLVRDPVGNFYGTVAQGGSAGWGVLYKLNTAGQETVLYNYPFGSDGGGAGVIRDTAGNLYGTIYQGAAAGSGAVYELDAGGNFTVLYNFTGGADGGQPVGPLSRDSSGNLYGVANIGGANAGGVVFKLTPQ